MAPQVPVGTSRPPRSRLLPEGHFYAAEVVQILGLDGIDYAQLRRLSRLVRGEAGQQPRRSWTRHDFRDLVGIRLAMELAGGREALRRGRRLRLADLEAACARLREAGFAQPLTEVHLQRTGGAIVAVVDGVLFRPRDGQLLFEEVAKAVDDFLIADANGKPAEVRELRRSAARFARTRASRSRAIRFPRDMAMGIGRTETGEPR